MIIKGPINPNPIRFQESKCSDIYQLPDDYIRDPNFSKRAAQRSMYPPQFCQAFFEANQ